QVPSGQSGHISQHRHSEGPQSATRSGVMVGNGLGSCLRNESHRRNRADIEASNIALSTHIEAAEGRNFIGNSLLGARRNGDQGRWAGRSGGPVRGDISDSKVRANHVAVLLHRMEVLHIKNGGNTFYFVVNVR